MYFVLKYRMNYINTPIPTQDIQGQVLNEYINMGNALKMLKNLESIVNKLPEGRKVFLKEKSKGFDPLLLLKKIFETKNNIYNVVYLPSKSLKNLGRLFAQSASLQNLPREFI